MGFELESFRDESLEADYVTYLVQEQSAANQEHFGRMWEYFRNELSPAAGIAAGALNAGSRPYFQAQEVGLPPRITGVDRGGLGGEQLTDIRRKEVVVENDIAWRVQTMIDFLFPKAPRIRSLAGDAELAGAIELAIAALLEANGGASLLQEMALLGSVYGFVDVALRTPAGGMAVLPDTRAAAPPPPSADAQADRRPATSYQPDRGRALDLAVAAAGQLQLEPVEATRIVPVLDENDYRRVRYWVQRFDKHPPRMSCSHRPWYAQFFGGGRRLSPAVTEVIEIIGPHWWQRYEDRRLAAEGPNVLGCLPVVHVPNVPVPGCYEGLSDVEPLIPLQDELNTRLSDRASRVTYQSFKMYLGKGIDDFLERPVGPGQMWATQNLDASIEEFGSDSGSPSEDAHIEHVRAALDKVSGVTPLAAGLIRGNVGYLTSATALRVLLSGLLARTAKKRLAYGAGLAQIVELALSWLDLAGLLRTAPADRRVEVLWPDPLPTDEGERLRNAQVKAALGVPAERVLAELGYGPEQSR